MLNEGFFYIYFIDNWKTWNILLILIYHLLLSLARILFFVRSMFVSKEISFDTKKSFEIRDITDEAELFLNECKWKNGLLNIFTRHTTATLMINEAEEWFWNDLAKRSDRNVPVDAEYQHNDLEHRDPKTMCPSKEECLNGHSHIRDMLLGSTSETIPVQDGKMLLWVWQRILFMELDHARERKVVMSFMGDINE